MKSFVSDSSQELVKPDVESAESCADSDHGSAKVSQAATHELDDMITRGEFDRALATLRSLPPSTPGLPRSMGHLVIAMALAGKYEDIDKLVPEALRCFPPGPEITEMLLTLATVLCRQGHFEQTFSAIEEYVAEGYGMGGGELDDLVRRLAYRCRRTGQHTVARQMLHAWHHAAV